jgi:hypothetical protein
MAGLTDRQGSNVDTDKCSHDDECATIPWGPRNRAVAAVGQVRRHPPSPGRGWPQRARHADHRISRDDRTAHYPALAQLCARAGQGTLSHATRHLPGFGPRHSAPGAPPRGSTPPTLDTRRERARR